MSERVIHRLEAVKVKKKDGALLLSPPVPIYLEESFAQKDSIGKVGEVIVPCQMGNLVGCLVGTRNIDDRV
ncbi:hypothetical protein SPHINGO391_350342 [Sphingomonas aurantiaca]|uniref:Uncharacterized protein n=1 Tax=Sphingomonas aurantiaca TaxID=185949 RepID=A0A5E7YBY9_9SPHN|nr:hypothetical protein SPHINGO391_350342 [Sphingomonas aurantiaca]